jgi:hypothetical protein
MEKIHHPSGTSKPDRQATQNVDPTQNFGEASAIDRLLADFVRREQSQSAERRRQGGAQ